MKEKLLQVKDLSFAYEKKQVLRNISISISRGEKIAIMGSNGAGKSTFFLNLNGVLWPDGGEVILDGKRIDRKNIQELRRKVGFVFQDADSQIIASTVKTEISFGPMNLRLDREEVRKRVEAAISYLSLEELQDRPPHYLSGGEKKRVSIADILAMEPEILIFDEPMAALDPVNAQNVETILQNLHKDGKTLLVATHDVDFAYRFADRILVFAEGRLIADGTPLEIFRKQEVMEQAHLRKPSMLTIWEALLDAQIVTEQKNYPVTPNEAAKEIAQYKKSMKGESFK